MEDVSSLQLAIQQQAQRSSALEELLRRNEGSLSAVLNRVKDIELGMNNFHKLLQHVVSENAALSKELMASKQKVDVVDRSWRTHIQQAESAIWNEIRSSKPQSLSADPTITRLMQETSAQRSMLSDLEIGLTRVTEAQAADTSAIRICEQHIQSTEGQVSELLHSQRDGGKDSTRRFEQMLRDAGSLRQDLDRSIQSLKSQTERQIREISSALEQQTTSLATFQQEAGTAIRGMREEVADGLSQASSSLRANEEAAKTLEQILRAEVQTRGTSVEQLSKKLSTLDHAVSTRLSIVSTHQTDITRLWDTIRATNHQRSQAERLDGVLSSISGGGGVVVAGNTSSMSGNDQQQYGGGAAAAGGGVNDSRLLTHGIAGIATLENLRDLEVTTSDRFDGMDTQMLQLAETLKRAHGGVEEQVDALASRFGRMEMRLEQIASRRDETASALQSRFMALSSADGSSGGGADGANEVVVKELVDTRFRVDRIDAGLEEVKFDVSDMLDAISAETGDLNRRLEKVESSFAYRVDSAASVAAASSAAAVASATAAAAASGGAGGNNGTALDFSSSRRSSGGSPHGGGMVATSSSSPVVETPQLAHTSSSSPITATAPNNNNNYRPPSRPMSGNSSRGGAPVISDGDANALLAAAMSPTPIGTNVPDDEVLGQQPL